MRLFAAIELSDEARRALVAEQERVIDALGKGGPSLRPVRPDHLHLTLAFMGMVPEALGAAVVEAMSRTVAYPPYPMVLGGVGVFPPRGAPRVLWIGLLEGGAETIELQRLVAGRLEAAGIALEQRPFHPHLTIARWRESRPSDRPRPGTAAVVARTDVGAVTLFESRLSSSGPAYAPLAHARLVCP